MNHKERFKAVMRGGDIDRLPRIEWANWWSETIQRWIKEGLPTTDRYELYKYFDLDMYYQYWINPRTEQMPKPEKHGGGLVTNFDGYNKFKAELYPEQNEITDQIARLGDIQDNNEGLVWLTFEGFFWWPRTLFGIEQHMYAFFDQPELMHQMNMDITDFNIKTFEKISKICTPTFVTFAEDMSYNNGPMLSRKMFNEFIAPYYKRIIPYLKEKDVVVLIDSDGYVLPMIDWLNDLGIDGILPLEHQAGVDVNNLQQEHPDFGLLGNFDKLVMDKGEKAIRDEFERLKPAISRGRFIPSVDHQTPPSVSLEQYKIYLEILREYTKRN